MAWKLTCKNCCCSSCSQQDNCQMNGCEGMGCTSDDLIYFKSDCDDYEVDPYSEPDDWDDEDEDE